MALWWVLEGTNLNMEAREISGGLLKMAGQGDAAHGIRTFQEESKYKIKEVLIIFHKILVPPQLTTVTRSQLHTLWKMQEV